MNTQESYRWDLKNANFEEFRNQVDSDLPPVYENKSLHKLEKILRKTITKAAQEHIGVKKSIKDAKPGFSKGVRKEIKERNMLRKNVKEDGGRKKWTEKCRKVKEMIRKEKEENWKEYVEELDTKTNCKQVWSTIRNLDGRVAQRKENEVLIVEGKGLVSDKDKAKEFAKMYKKVSKLPKGPKDRIIKRQNRKFLSSKPKEKSRFEVIWSIVEQGYGYSGVTRK